jgi:hypothetical protein
MPDSNDVAYNEYSLDFFGFLELFFSFFFGGGGSGNGINSGSGLASGFSPELIVAWITNAWTVFTIISWLISALLIYGLIYAFIRDEHLAEIELEGVFHREKLYSQLYRSGTKNKRWDDVEYHIGTNNPNDWKLAIIEADIMLGEMLENIGYAGVTIGDKLKSASASSFTTLDQAWRAHRVRNEVAHGGADFVLTKKMAEDTIKQYKMVFKEFGVI